jgi:hypothetical protein
MDSDRHVVVPRRDDAQDRFVTMQLLSAYRAYQRGDDKEAVRVLWYLMVEGDGQGAVTVSRFCRWLGSERAIRVMVEVLLERPARRTPGAPEK